MQFSTGQDVRLKNYPARSFLWTVLKHGLLEGSTILLQYSAITGTPVESSPSAELKYAISPGYNVRPKNKSIRKWKKWHCSTGVHGHCIADWFRQVRTSWISQDTCEVLFSLNRELHSVQNWPTHKPACSFLTVPRSKLYDPPKVWNQGFVTLQLA